MIHYHIGDATRPEDTIEIEGTCIIAHICNNKNKWGSGFVLAVSKRWPEAEEAYRSLDFSGSLLGTVQFYEHGDFTIANMIAQHDVRSVKNPRPIRYDALRECLHKVKKYANAETKAYVCMPRIGCGLAMGNWDVIEKIIEEELADVDVHVFDLAG